MEKPFLKPLRNHFVVRQPNAFQSERPKLVPPKVVESNDSLNSVTSNSVPITTKTNVMKNDKVIAPGMLRINHSKTSRVDNDMPNKHVKARVKSTAKTRRPQHRSITKNDRVPSASKSSCIKNKDVEVEEHHRNLLLSKNKKHMSSDCNNNKLAIQNDKSKVVCVMCYPNFFMVRQLGLFQAYDRESKASHQFRLEVFRNCPVGNDHVAAILDLKVAFRRNTCFVKNLEGVNLLKGNHTTNLYTINLHEMASASLICLMAHATSNKSWLWHQRLSYLNFDTINDLAKNDLVTGLSKFKYHKEHLCPSCEHGKSKKASHPPKAIPNSKQ
ncbi:retrovirus-related pol polyprotein from transposon TNT 1-94, partial [Tanacetum coccineum]